jgi:KUP system potassium uptake protein
MAGAYGIAIAATMVITTLLAFPVAWKLWGWPLPLAIAVTLVFVSIDFVFFGANIVKIVHGGWFPLVVGAIIFFLMTTWKRGREVLNERVRARLVPLESFLEHLKYDMPVRVKGTAIFMSGNLEMTPIALLHNLKHNQVLHERVVLTEEVSHVAHADHLEHTLLADGFHRIIARHGFMEEPDVPQLLKKCASKGLHFEMARTTFFLGRETILASKNPGMAIWREKIFALMTRNAQSATTYFKIPAERVIEVGAQVEM